MRSTIAGLLLLPALAGLTAAAAPVGNVTRGKSLYEETGCAYCHGFAGQGSQATGPKLARTPHPLVSFLLLLRHPARQMPPYEQPVLSDQEAADILAYLQQLPEARAPETIPLLGTGR